VTFAIAASHFASEKGKSDEIVRRGNGRGFMIAMMISNMCVRLLKLLILSESSLFSFHFLWWLFSALSPVRSIESVHEDIGMLQTPVFS
jgi:hypothetical protein